MSLLSFLRVAHELEHVGLVWQPEIGDEVSQRTAPEMISILVDPNGMTPKVLRETYVWLPTVEQLVAQFEARQAFLFHAGIELDHAKLAYKTIVQVRSGHIESSAETLRSSMGLVLHQMLVQESGKQAPNRLH